MSAVPGAARDLAAREAPGRGVRAAARLLLAVCLGAAPAPARVPSQPESGDDASPEAELAGLRVLLRAELTLLERDIDRARAVVSRPGLQRLDGLRERVELLRESVSNLTETDGRALKRSRKRLEAELERLRRELLNTG